MNHLILTVLIALSASGNFVPLEDFPLKVHPCFETRYDILKGRLANQDIGVEEFKTRFHSMIDEANSWMDAIDKRRNGAKEILTPLPHEFNGDPFNGPKPACRIELKLPRPQLPVAPKIES